MKMATPADDPYAPTAPGTKPPTSGGAPSPGLSGRRLGDYEILDTLGEGGMGIVYRARDVALEREVALKVLQPALAQDEEYERRFVREARVAAKLDHPNIVAVYAAGRHENVLYMAMQLVRGRTLHQVLRERKRLPVAEALSIVRQAAEALETAHKAGLVHRDIKPNNIMVDGEGRVKIMDFGLMRSRLSGDAITRSGDFFGTPEYASPEQCETAELDGRSDLYSLGAVLYEMLAGRMPHKADTPMALFKKIQEEEPRPIRKSNREVPPVVEALVSKLLAKKPSDRFASAAELIREIDRIAAGGRVRREPRHSLAALSVAGLAVVALLIGFGYRAKHPPKGKPAPAAAVVAKAERLRLAVFDLRNGTAETQAAWYEIALSDLLIASLSQQAALDVPTRDQMLWKVKEMRLSGPAGDDHRRVLTQELGAAAYLSGTYYVRNGKIRLTLSGYRLPDNAPLFPVKTFEKGEDEMFALVDEAARAVAKDLERPGAVMAAAALRPCQEVAVAYRRAPEPKQQQQADRTLALVEKSATASDKKESGNAGESLGKAAPERPQAGAAPHAPRPEERRKATSVTDGELMKAWYQNLHALEACKFEKEEFEGLSRSLAGQFQAGRVDASSWKQGVDNFKDGINRLREAKLKDAGPRGGRAAAAVDFACPGCGAMAAQFGRCPKCDAYLILRIKVAGIEKKE